MSIHIRNIHRHKLIHKSQLVAIASYSGDLTFYTATSNDGITLKLRIDKTQIFPSKAAKEEYYNGKRDKINLLETPSYFLTYHLTEKYPDNNHAVLEFIKSGINKIYPIDEFEFFGPLKTGRWFFKDGESDMMESETNDLATIDGVQYYFYSSIESYFDSTKMSNELLVSLVNKFPINSVEVGQDFWFYYAYITFKAYSPIIDLENEIRKNVKRILLENSFIFFGGESIPPANKNTGN